MPIVATLHHQNDSIVPPFVVLTPHEMRYCFVEPMALGCNGDVLQARDGALSRTVITTGTEGSICSISQYCWHWGIDFG